MDSATLGWVAEVVLPKRYLDSCGGIDLIRMCACQHGRCGHCAIGRHHHCATREWTPPGGPHTHIVGRHGGAITPVWTTGKACAWRCPCDCPTPEPVVAAVVEPPAVEQLGLFDLVGAS